MRLKSHNARHSLTEAVDRKGLSRAAPSASDHAILHLSESGRRKVLTEASRPYFPPPFQVARTASVPTTYFQGAARLEAEPPSFSMNGSLCARARSRSDADCSRTLSVDGSPCAAARGRSRAAGLTRRTYADARTWGRENTPHLPPSPRASTACRALTSYSHVSLVTCSAH